MPKRVIDFDAMWNSEKLSHCKESCRVEYAWMYGLADANGSFELTSERVVWARISPVRPRLTVKKIAECVLEYTRNGLLFVWEEDGKKYGHWTNSDIPGRLPKPSERSRYTLSAPPVPKAKLTEYMSNFSKQHRPPAAMLSRQGLGVGVGFGVGKGLGDALVGHKGIDLDADYPRPKTPENNQTQNVLKPKTEKQKTNSWPEWTIPKYDPKWYQD